MPTKQSQPVPSTPHLSHGQKLLQREVKPSDDPVCSCEAEPRWLRFQSQTEHPDGPTEWDSLDRPPSEEL